MIHLQEHGRAYKSMKLTADSITYAGTSLFRKVEHPGRGTKVKIKELAVPSPKLGKTKFNNFVQYGPSYTLSKRSEMLALESYLP